MKIIKKEQITSVLMLTIAGVINAFGITVFLMPVNLYDSGISFLHLFLLPYAQIQNQHFFLVLKNKGGNLHFMPFMLSVFTQSPHG